MLLASFSAFALTRSEMKNVVGGATCHVQTTPGQKGSGTVVTKGSYSTYAEAAAATAKQNGGHWCCEGCGTASWCVNC